MLHTGSTYCQGHCLDNKQKFFLCQWNILFYNSFLDVILPRKWIPQPKNREGEELNFHLVELDPVSNAQEYQEVQNQFRKTCKSKIMILKIARVQNPALYRTFTMRKQKMDEERGSNEQRLFLGIPRSKCQQINETGFCHFQNKKGTKNHFYYVNCMSCRCVHI